MTTQRTLKLFRILVLALVGASLASCHFCGWHHYRCWRPPVHCHR